MRQSVCDRLEISERRWPRLALTLSGHVVECDHPSGAIAALSGGEGIERVPYAGTLVHQQLLREGHQAGSTTVRAYLAEQRRARQEVYLPLVWRAGDGA